MRKHTYECDRCHESSAVEAHLPPEGWGLFKLQAVPAPLDLGTALADAMRPAQHLCSTCVGELQEWLGSPELKVVR